MPKNLVIVESPAKAGTIEGYLGKDFKVASSYGHVRDLPKGDNAIDIDHGYQPKYEVSPDKKEVVRQLKKLAKEADTVYLATDDDREGEAIAWHLLQALGLDEKTTKRIVFREITKNAVLKSLETPRGIDMELVHAQQARRVLDRLVGFELSPILWRKIKSGLSAGRVQSVAVRLVVEREREIEKFKPQSSFKVTALFRLDTGEELQAELPHKLATAEEARHLLEDCRGAAFTIEALEKKPAKKTPAAPFTTSTLQQEASRKLGFSVAQTMRLAQQLYENGLITYMRTDSTHLSQEAVAGATREIKSAWGEEYVKVRQYKTKSAGAQEAHEAIRPTDFSRHRAGLDRQSTRLYELIWKRAIASQMADARLEKTTVTIGISSRSEHLVATGEVVLFDGFLKVYVEGTDEDNGQQRGHTGMLPPLQEGQRLLLEQMQARQVFTRHPARYTEASLVKKLEELGIGRPSTYAPTISTIIKRNYVVKESREGKPRHYQIIRLDDSGITATTETEIAGSEKNKLFPTDMGMIVNDFLVEHFPDIVDYSFTAKVEEEFDKIASGQEDWSEMIDNFYHPFHKRVEETADVERPSQERLLGQDPETGRNVYARMGRFGPYVQIGENGDRENGGEKPRSASLRNGQLIENITLEEALELFRLPREVGEFEGEPMVVGIGRFGPYVRHKGKFVSLGKEDDPYTLTAERAIELIEAKRAADANRIIKTFAENPDIQVLNGKYGPYIKAGRKNVKIPKGTDPATLTLEQCLELAAKAPEKKRRGRR